MPSCSAGVKERDVCCWSLCACPCLSRGLSSEAARGRRGSGAVRSSPLSVGSAREAEEHVLRLVPLRVTRPLALLQEHRSLLLKMKEGEAELARLRSAEGDRLAEQDR